MKNNLFLTLGAVAVGLAAAGAIGYAAGRSMNGTRRDRPAGTLKNTMGSMSINDDFTEIDKEIIAEVVGRESGMNSAIG
ncbi:MAG: hypothetical protein ACOYIA_05885 [Eubacteriales bacterium]